MRYKTVTENLFTVVGTLVETSITSIEKPKGYIEAYISIRKPTITVTSNIPVIPPSLSPYFLSVY